MIKFICNKFDEIKQIYDDTLVDKVWPSELSKETSEFFNDINGIQGSFCIVNKRIGQSCQSWHTDEYGKINMLISSYPNTTQIALPITERAKRFNRKYSDSPCRIKQQSRELEELIYNEEFKIFQPQPGDIYYLCRRVIHRTNPLAWGRKTFMCKIMECKTSRIEKTLCSRQS